MTEVPVGLRTFLMGCLHDPANVQQTSNKCIQNTRANAGRLLDTPCYLQTSQLHGTDCCAPGSWTAADLFRQMNRF